MFQVIQHATESSAHTVQKFIARYVHMNVVFTKGL